MDPVEKGKEQMGSLERAISGLPVISDYREKEMRREADKRVRNTLTQELETRRIKITNLQHELLSSGGLLWMDDMERVVGRLQLLIDRIRTAAYGYAPFFDLERIRQDELDRLIEYDRALFENLPALDQAVADLEKAIRANENIQGSLQGIATLLADLSDKFGRRMEAIRVA
jgi:hypothetical protein